MGFSGSESQREFQRDGNFRGTGRILGSHRLTAKLLGHLLNSCIAATPSRLDAARLQRAEYSMFASRIRGAAGHRRMHRLARVLRELDLALQEPGPAEIFGDEQCGLSHSVVHPHISPEFALHPVGLEFPDP